MALFTGKQECSVDDKRRFSLPPKFRDLFPGRERDSRGQPVVILPWFQGSLCLAPMPVWSAWEDRIELLNAAIPEHLNLLNVVLPRVERVETDPEGRLSITPEHAAWVRLIAGRKGRVVVASQGSTLAVWNAEEFPEVQRTGGNPVQRTGDDLTYEENLKKLLEASQTAWTKLGRPDHGGPTP